MNKIIFHRFLNERSSTNSLVQAATVCVLLLIASLAAYSPIIESYFVADDFGYVDLYMRQQLADMPRLFAADWSQGIWGFNLRELRPVIALSFMWDALLWGADPLGYHLTNLFVHSASSALVFFTLRRLLEADLTTSALAAVLFAVHPVHVEAVSWVSGRSELISIFFYLSSFLTFGIYRSVERTRYYILSLTLFVLGLFSKEMVMSLPLMLVAYDVVCHRTTIVSRQIKWWLPHICYFTILVLYLCLRKLIFENALRNINIPDFVLRQGEYLSYLFPPLNMLVGNVRSGWLLLLWTVLLFAFTLLLLLHRGARSRAQAMLAGVARPALFFGIVWYLISIIPLAATYRSDRHLYLPSFGLCVAVGIILPRIVTKRWMVKLVFAVLIAMCSAGSLYYAVRWRQAAQISRQMRDDMQQLVRDVPEGSGIIFVNTPGTYQGKYVWAWATPFVLRKPFSDSDIYSRFHVLEAPSSYCCLWAQDRLSVVLDFINQPVDSYLIYLDEMKRLTKTPLPKEQVKDLLNSIVVLEQRTDVQNKTFKNPEVLIANWEELWKPHIKP
ncbi:MAG: hypothetical protein H0W34_04780 [Pyrinomonadaceae bacterium]|nr:hypothetical protein [Pyrinomonadaceae bacterium]